MTTQLTAVPNFSKPIGAFFPHGENMSNVSAFPHQSSATLATYEHDVLGPSTAPETRLAPDIIHVIVKHCIGVVYNLLDLSWQKRSTLTWPHTRGMSTHSARSGAKSDEVALYTKV